MSDLEPIQASRYNTAEHATSETEMARQVAAALKWKVHREFGSIHEETGMVVAASIDALALAGAKLGWFIGDIRGIYWGAVHSNEPWRSAIDVRKALRDLSGGSSGRGGLSGIVLPK